MKELGLPVFVSWLGVSRRKLRWRSPRKTSEMLRYSGRRALINGVCQGNVYFDLERKNHSLSNALGSPYMRYELPGYLERVGILCNRSLKARFVIDECGARPICHPTDKRGFCLLK